LPWQKQTVTHDTPEAFCKAGNPHYPEKLHHVLLSGQFPEWGLPEVGFAATLPMPHGSPLRSGLG
jgi:hypothetical protein